MADKTLAQFEAELMQAHRVLAEARQASRMASSRETDALNAVNDAQKRFDDKVATIRNGALGGTDWASSARRAAA